MSDESTAHPHDLQAPIPERLDVAVLRRLSRISPARALAAIATEWTAIAAVIAAASLVDRAALTVAAVILVGARQHALLVIAHDAAHFRLLPGRGLNDWVGNLLLAWPMFISVQGFRHFHGEHHRHLNQAGDGNRVLWRTHGADGRLTPEWRYPKTVAGLVGTLARRVFMLTGVLWMLRGLVGGFMIGATPASHVARASMLAGTGVVLTLADAWGGFLLFWVVPYCTWHVVAQYVRLICEHSAVRADDPRYGETRTTVPGRLGRLFVLPRNIGYHIEHHWYPSVPFYRLPELHAQLSRQPGFAAHAQHTRSIVASLAQCVRRAGREAHRAVETGHL